MRAPRIQRFGSALNLNPHLHMLFVDGAYAFDDEAPRFHRVAAAIATRTTRAPRKPRTVTPRRRDPPPSTSNPTTVSSNFSAPPSTTASPPAPTPGARP